MNEKDIEKIADKIFEKMEKRKSGDKYTETEAMLRSYPLYKINLKRNEDEIVQIKEKGLMAIKSKPVFSENIKGGIIKIEGIPEKELSRIEYLEGENRKLEKRIFRVEDALKYFERDKYFKIIELRYFKNFTIEEISEEIGVTEKTIGKNRTRLVEGIQYLLFPEVLLD